MRYPAYAFDNMKPDDDYNEDDQEIAENMMACG
jgi:hypothetical protein